MVKGGIIEILGEYQTNVKRALTEIDPQWESYDGLIVCGTHHPKNVEKQIEKIKEVREHGIPFLGICMGMQLAVIEFVRHVMGIEDATSEEFDVKGTPIIIKMPQLRVGIYPVDGKPESHWHNYYVNPDYILKIGKFLYIKTVDFEDLFIVEIIGLPKLIHPWFNAYQYHPEYQSSKKDPHPVLKDFLDAAKKATMVM